MCKPEDELQLVLRHRFLVVKTPLCRAFKQICISHLFSVNKHEETYIQISQKVNFPGLHVTRTQVHLPVGVWT